MITATVDGWSCSSLRQPAPDGVVRKLQAIRGWHGGLPVRANPVQVGSSDGVLDGPVTLGGRTVEVVGLLEAPTDVTLWAAMRETGAVLTSNRVGALVVDGPGSSLRALVRLAGETLVEQIGARVARFSLALFAPDPLLYSSTLHQASTARYAEGGGRTYNLTFPRTYGPSGTAGFVTVTNVGDSPTWPVLRLTGPLVNPVVTLGGGGRVAPVMALAAAQQLVIDMGARTVLLGEASRRSMLAWDSSWWPLPVGSSQVFFAADSGTGTLTVEWRDAWA